MASSTPPPSTLHSTAFARLLRHHRRAAGLTQEGLAETAGVSVRSIRDMERGVARVPHKETIALLAESLALAPRETAAFVLAARSSGTPPSPHSQRGGKQPLPVLVGREAELAGLQRHLEGKGPPLMILAGEPGIGKTRLLQEAADQAAQFGWRVLAGSCTRNGGEVPYAPLLDALHAHIESLPARQQRTALVGCPWLVRLLPELAGGSAIEPLPRWTLSPEQERRLTFRSVGQFLANVGGPVGTLLVLDDLQWAGSDGLDLLSTLLRSTDAPVRVVGAYRDTEVSKHSPLSSMLADLAYARLVTQKSLRPLSDAEANSLLDTLLVEMPNAHQAQRTRLLQRAGGVPFFLVSCGEALAQSAADDVTDSVPWDIAQGIRQRATALSATARTVLGAAAIAGRSVTPSLLLAMSDLPRTVVLESLDAACSARLLVEDGASSYRFAHDVIREVLERDMGAGRRMELHLRAAVALEALPGPQPVDLLAYHYARSDSDAKAALYLEQAGDKAWAQHANDAAAAYYEQLLARRVRGDRPLEQAAAGEKLGRALRTLAQYEAAITALEQATADYGAATDLDGAARATAELGYVHLDQGNVNAGLQRLAPVVAAAIGAAPSHGLVALHVAMAHLLFMAGRTDEQLVVAGRARAMAQALGDDFLLADSESIWGMALAKAGRIEEARQAGLESIRLTEAIGDLEKLIRALELTTYVTAFWGDVAGAEQYVARAVVVAEQSGNPVMLVNMTALRGEVAFWLGNWDQARADLERATALSRAQVPDLAPNQWLAELYMAEGDWEKAFHLMEASRSLAERTGDMVQLVGAEIKLAELDLLSGQPLAARDRLLPLRAQGGGWLLPRLAWAYLELGEVDTAEEVLATAGSMTIDAFAAGELARVQAMLATRQGRWQVAERHLEEGLAIRRRMPYPYEEARLLQVYAQMYLAKGDQEHERAHERLEEALAIFRRLGARKDIERTEKLLVTLP